MRHCAATLVSNKDLKNLIIPLFLEQPLTILVGLVCAGGGILYPLQGREMEELSADLSIGESLRIFVERNGKKYEYFSN